MPMPGLSRATVRRWWPHEYSVRSYCSGAHSAATGASTFSGRPGMTPMTTHGSSSASCRGRSEEHTSELQSLAYLVCRLLLEKKKQEQQQVKTGQLRTDPAY